MGIKVKIDLDANTDKLAAAIQQGVAKGFQGVGTSGLATNPASVVRQIMGTQGTGMRSYGDTMGATAMPSQHDFFGGRGRAAFWSKIVPPKIADVLSQSQSQRASFFKNMGFAGIPIMAPGSLLGNMFASRQIFSGLSSQMGQGLLGKVGIGGTAGTVAATGGIMGILLAVGASLKVLAATVRAANAAFDEARKLYAKSLLSGLGIKFTIGRNNLAEVLGVSEKEVMQFGAAMGILGPKLKFASDVMAKATPNLTSVAWEFSVMKKNLEALFFTIANDAAPSLRKFADGISQMINILTRGIQVIENSPFSKIIKAYIEGMMGPFSMIGRDMGAAPNPQGLMKQLPASHLERMGLVVSGFNPGNDAAQRTAKATEKTAKILENMMVRMPGSQGNFGDSFMNMP